MSRIYPNDSLEGIIVQASPSEDMALLAAAGNSLYLVEGELGREIAGGTTGDVLKIRHTGDRLMTFHRGKKGIRAYEDWHTLAGEYADAVWTRQDGFVYLNAD